MNITFLCSDLEHPVNKHLIQWKSDNKHKYNIDLIRSKKEISSGQILFLISCSEIIKLSERDNYETTLVLHGSALPQGKGWSPHVWEIINGGNEITVSLIEAEDKVDSGDIWHQIKFNVPQNALWDEINDKLFETEIKLINFAVQNFKLIKPTPQKNNIEQTFFPKRNPIDSRIDPNMSIESQFNKIRVCDPKRYPAYIELHGFKYKLTLKKISDIDI